MEQLLDLYGFVSVLLQVAELVARTTLLGGVAFWLLVGLPLAPLMPPSDAARLRALARWAVVVSACGGIAATLTASGLGIAALAATLDASPPCCSAPISSSRRGCRCWPRRCCWPWRCRAACRGRRGRRRWGSVRWRCSVRSPPAAMPLRGKKAGPCCWPPPGCTRRARASGSAACPGCSARCG
ncbi:hypothetical protein ACFQU2_24240 [Siccirubricoccus deserti]